MKNLYAIGRFRFDTYEEYKMGLADVKKIRGISRGLNVREPGVALRLCTLVRNKEIKFQSVIGEDYLLYLSSLAAGNDEERKARAPRKLAGILSLLLAAICFAGFLGNELMSVKRAGELRQLQESRELARTVDFLVDRLNLGDPNQQEEASLGQTALATAPMLAELAGLYRENNDLAGWIKIPGTVIDYPVMQSKEDQDYYLRRNFYKQDDQSGSLFLDFRNDLSGTGQNMIIYGHNMRNGQKFGGLKEYLEESYWEEHKWIEFNTLYESRKYVIMAVGFGRVLYQQEDGFRYYDFIDIDKESVEEFKQFIAQANVLGQEPDLNDEDQILTLSTCNDFSEHGRLFLVAKRML